MPATSGATTHRKLGTVHLSAASHAVCGYDGHSAMEGAMIERKENTRRMLRTALLRKTRKCRTSLQNPRSTSRAS